jgi:hypothetical protein
VLVSPLIGPIENPAALFRELLAQGRRKTDDCQLSGAAVHAEEWDTGYSTASEELVRHHVLQRANIILRHVPILAFAPFKLFVVDTSAKSLKCVGKTEGIISQIFVDLSFNQHMAMGTLRACQDTQRGEAWPEPRHVSSCKSPLHHERCCKPSVPTMAERRRFNVNRASSASG